MKTNRTLFLCLIFALAAIDTFTQTKPKIEDNLSTDFLGATGEGTYRNGFFGFSLNFPKSWSFLSREQIAQSMQIGQDILKTPAEKNNQAIEVAAAREVLILVITEKAKALENTASLTVGVRKQPGAQVTSEMVMDATKKLLLGSIGMKLVRDTQKIKLGGEAFANVELQNNWKGEYVYQKLYTTIRKGYSLTFVMTYKKTESLQAMENIVQSLSFVNQ
jgi:hypothetical protein